MNPTPLQIFLHKKGWRLSRLEAELRKRNTPVSHPTMVNINRGCRIVKGKKIKYNPSLRTLADIAKVCKLKPTQIYADRSN